MKSRVKQGSKHTAETSAKIVRSKCSSVTERTKDGPKQFTQCDIGITYSVQDKNYSANLFTNDNKVYQESHVIEIMYDPLDPHNVRKKELISLRAWGIGLIVVGTFIIISSIIWFILTLYYKSVAVGEAAFTTIDAFTPDFK